MIIEDSLSHPISWMHCLWAFSNRSRILTNNKKILNLSNLSLHSYTTNRTEAHAKKKKKEPNVVFNLFFHKTIKSIKAGLTASRTHISPAGFSSPAGKTGNPLFLFKYLVCSQKGKWVHKKKKGGVYFWREISIWKIKLQCKKNLFDKIKCILFSFVKWILTLQLSSFASEHNVL